MKKILYLMMPVALVSMFAFTDTASALGQSAEDVLATQEALSHYNNSDPFDPTVSNGYTTKAQCEAAECASYCGGFCYCVQQGNRWVVSHACPYSCNSGEYCSHMNCVSGGQYTCTQQSSGCWTRDNSNTFTGIASLSEYQGDMYATLVAEELNKDPGLGGGTTTVTQRVSGNCPAGTSLSTDKCCCVANN